MNLFFAFLLSIVISIALIPLLMRYAGYFNLIDQPAGRKVHTAAIPRCGGLGLAFGALITILLFVPMLREIRGMIWGCVVILGFGLLDDSRELNYKWKFLGQLLAVLIVIGGGVQLHFLPFAGLDAVSPYITLPLTVVFATGVINAVNLSDGLDGLAAGTMLMSFAVIAFLAIEANGMDIAVIALAVAGGIAGFLWFNTHPAVVFMGDTGSQFLGLMAVTLGIILTQHTNQALNPALPLLLLGLPILDTLTVMVRRIRAGRSPFSPDKTHIHHRLMEHGFTHAEAVGIIYLLQGAFLGSALVFRYSGDLQVMSLYGSISGSILWFLYWAAKNQWQFRVAATDGNRRRGAAIWRKPWLFQFCRHYINIALVLFLGCQIYCLLEQLTSLWLVNFFVLSGCFLVFLLLPGKWQDYWVRFSVYLSALFPNVMGQEFPEKAIHWHGWMDVFMLLLFAVVSIAIRITRKSKFRMTTQDVLVVLFVLTAMLLSDVVYIEHLTIRLLCLVYASEYLLHRNVYPFRWFRYTAAGLGILILTMLLVLNPKYTEKGLDYTIMPVHMFSN